MRKLTFMLLILLAAIGCSKKEEDTPKPGSGCAAEVYGVYRSYRS